MDLFFKIRSNEAIIFEKDLVEKTNRIYTIKYGTILIDKKPIKKIKLINIDYKTNLIFDGKQYTNSSEIYTSFSSFLKNQEFEKAVGLKQIVEQKHIQKLNSAAQIIAQKNPSFKLWNYHSFAPYRTLLVKKGLS